MGHAPGGRLGIAGGEAEMNSSLVLSGTGPVTEGESGQQVQGNRRLTEASG
ncbi:MAG: hypothetical protein WB800_37630 [Streptosporangiaceae bacterium]